MRSQLQAKEPAMLTGAITSILGFVALLGADVHTLQGLGTALGISGTQGLLTRHSVFSPKSVDQIKKGKTPLGSMAALLGGRSDYFRQCEPAVGIGLASLLGGFLVQFFAGVDLSQALASAAGITGVQAVATRQQVYSPATARRAAAATLIATMTRKHRQASIEVQEATLKPTLKVGKSTPLGDPGF